MTLLHSILDGLGALLLISAGLVALLLLSDAMRARRGARDYQDVDDLVRARRRRSPSVPSPMPATRTVAPEQAALEREALRTVAVRRLTPTRPRPPLAS